MEKIVTTDNEAELVALKSLFEAEGIQYFVHNDNFGTILTGPQIPSYNTKTILVPSEFATRAREIVEDFRGGAPPERPAPRFSDRVRMVLETVVFSWFVPGRRWRGSRRQGGDDAKKTD